MTRKSTQILAAVVVGLLLLLFVLQSNDRTNARVSGDPLLPEFRAHAGDVSEIRVLLPGDADTVTINSSDDMWAVRSRHGYAADVVKLRQLVSALADAKIVEEKTSNPENYPKLGVDDPALGGKGSKVVVTGADFSYAVILGNTTQGSYRYARLADAATSYLINQNPDVPGSAGEWLRPDIVDIKSADVQRVTITHTDGGTGKGETITIEKSDREQNDFDVPDIPEGRELSYATVGNGIAGALASLELEDVRPQTDASVATQAVFETWDGIRVIVAVLGDAGEPWIAFAAEATGEAPEAGDQAATLNARLSPWQYRLAEHKTNQLTRGWDDILKSTE